MTDVFAPTPFDVHELYPVGLPQIHPAAATYRAGLLHFAKHLSAAAERLQDAIATSPDADAAIDAEAARIADAWFAVQRTLVHYRVHRDVEGWA